MRPNTDQIGRLYRRADPNEHVRCVRGVQLALIKGRKGMPSLKREQNPIDVLERVVKGVHIDARGRHNNRVMPRPLDRINDAPPRPPRRPRRRGKRARRKAG